MSNRAVVCVKVVVHIACLLPFLFLLNMYRNGSLALEPDPVSYITHFTGNWALWILLADLAITPIRRLNVRLAWLVRLRRMVGLYCFFYATLHLLTYVFLFSGYDVPAAIAGVQTGNLGAPWEQFKLVWPGMLGDAERRPFIQLGFGAWLILLALAVTSPQRVLRAMGGKAWRRLHWLIYIAAIAAVTHYWWLVKAGVLTPWKDTAVLIVLLLARVGWWAKKRMQRPKAVVAAGAVRA